MPAELVLMSDYISLCLLYLQHCEYCSSLALRCHTGPPGAGSGANGTSGAPVQTPVQGHHDRTPKTCSTATLQRNHPPTLQLAPRSGQPYPNPPREAVAPFACAPHRAAAATDWTVRIRFALARSGTSAKCRPSLTEHGKRGYRGG
jgi:hypothetical protein